ncbi:MULTISPECIES: hypothetical protein [Pseudomonas]|uniref:hypothetical protein n=1 Tax=Pseudomonas TaxID=286 RepID=UPI0034A00C3B
MTSVQIFSVIWLVVIFAACIWRHTNVGLAMLPASFILAEVAGISPKQLYQGFPTSLVILSNRLANSPLSTQTSSDKNGWKTKPCPQVYPLNKPVSDVGHAEPASGSQSTMASLYTSAPHTP